MAPMRENTPSALTRFNLLCDSGREPDSRYLTLITPVGHSIALLITVLSGYQVCRQKITAYQNIRDFLIAVYVLTDFLIVLD